MAFSVIVKTGRAGETREMIIDKHENGRITISASNKTNEENTPVLNLSLTEINFIKTVCNLDFWVEEHTHPDSTQHSNEEVFREFSKTILKTASLPEHELVSRSRYSTRGILSGFSLFRDSEDFSANRNNQVIFSRSEFDTFKKVLNSIADFE